MKVTVPELQEVYEYYTSSVKHDFNPRLSAREICFALRKVLVFYLRIRHGNDTSSYALSEIADVAMLTDLTNKRRLQKLIPVLDLWESDSMYVKVSVNELKDARKVFMSTYTECTKVVLLPPISLDSYQYQIEAWFSTGIPHNFILQVLLIHCGKTPDNLCEELSIDKVQLRNWTLGIEEVPMDWMVSFMHYLDKTVANYNSVCDKVETYIASKTKFTHRVKNRFFTHCPLVSDDYDNGEVGRVYKGTFLDKSCLWLCVGRGLVVVDDAYIGNILLPNYNIDINGFKLCASVKADMAIVFDTAFTEEFAPTSIVLTQEEVENVKSYGYHNVIFDCDVKDIIELPGGKI